MKRYLIYDKNGIILRRGQCIDKVFGLQTAPGEFIMEGVADDITQKVINGEIVDKTPEEIKAEKPPEPKPALHEK